MMLAFCCGNLFVFDTGVNEPHEGLRKNESLWPIHQITWQKSRYVYDMYYTYDKISKDVYDYCVNNKIIDAALIAKWKKPGYERLCSTYVINPRNYKFGTVSICRVPKQFLAPGTEIEDPVTGCRGCASGSNHNIFGNKYGQYLAAIQIAREEKAAARRKLQEQEQEDEEGEEDGSQDEAEDTNEKTLWSSKIDPDESDLREEMIGFLAPEAKREAMQALSKAKRDNTDDIEHTHKRHRVS
jgi:bud site selection protein 31